MSLLMAEKANIPNWFVALLCSTIVFVGVASLALPYPTSWMMPNDCDFLEGTVKEKRIEEKTCLFGSCAGDSILVIVPDDNSSNKTIHVSPAIYYSHSYGSRYNNYICV